MNDPAPKEPRLRTAREGPLAWLRLNRPHVRNAVDDALRDELVAAVEALERDSMVRVLILTGEGTAFCAGGDISGMRRRLEEPITQVAAAGWHRIRQAELLVRLLHGSTKTTIAAVNGAAFGYGMDLALSCDFVLASEAAIFSMSYVQRGLIPDGGGLYFLPRRVGLPRAKELILSGRRVEAGEALSLGIADRVVPAPDLEHAAEGWARELAANGATATALAKSILDRSLELSLDDVLALGAQATAICYTTDEHRDSVTSFLESRRRSEKKHG